MIRVVATIPLLLLLFAGSALGGSNPGNEAAAMFRKLLEAPATRSYPEEFNSFANTINNARKLLSEGDNAGADQLFSLAVLKGELLLQRLPAAPLPVAAPPTVFRKLSSAGKAVAAAPSKAMPSPPPVPPAAGPDLDEAEDSTILSARIIGGEGVYVVKRKEPLKLVASRLGVRTRDLARMNRLKTDARVTPGQSLRYNNRRIAPKAMKNGIVVNIPDRNLYLFRNGKVQANYPVALGIAKKGESTIWRTPTGRFRIVDKKENPVWRIPPSIRKEMEEKGEEVVETVPPGPKNPLGKYAIRTDLSGILIHSTTRPSSINSYSSHGCIRVMPEHMERLFRLVKVPTDGEIIYQPVKVEVTDDGKVFLEVNRDSYEKLADLSIEVKKVLKKHSATEMVSWQKVNRVLNEQSGIAEDVTAD